jgi:hypothetical protein
MNGNTIRYLECELNLHFYTLISETYKNETTILYHILIFRCSGCDIIDQSYTL